MNTFSSVLRQIAACLTEFTPARWKSAPKGQFPTGQKALVGPFLVRDGPECIIVTLVQVGAAGTRTQPMMGD